MGNVKRVVGIISWVVLFLVFGWVILLIKRRRDEEKEMEDLGNYRAELLEAGPVTACPACAGSGVVTVVGSGAVPVNAERACTRCRGIGIVSDDQN